MMYCTCYCRFNDCGVCRGNCACAQDYEEDDGDWQNTVPLSQGEQKALPLFFLKNLL